MLSIKAKTLAIASIPAAISLPFIFWNAEGFLKSSLFSIIRYPEAHGAVRRASGAGGLLGGCSKVIVGGCSFHWSRMGKRAFNRA